MGVQKIRVAEFKISVMSEWMLIGQDIIFFETPIDGWVGAWVQPRFAPAEFRDGIGFLKAEYSFMRVIQSKLHLLW